MDPLKRYEYEHQFKVGRCPVCRQEWQVLMKKPDGTLAVYCTECLHEWSRIEDVAAPAKGVFTGLSLKTGKALDPSQLYTIPTSEEVAECGWDRFLI